MSEITPLEGITSQMVQTERLNTHLLTCGPVDGTPVVFLHGNFSAATVLGGDDAGPAPQGYRAIAPDLRGYGWTEDKLVDATRGMGDWSDDLAALFSSPGHRPGAPGRLVAGRRRASTVS